MSGPEVTDSIGDEAERDAWLREALRHAPDAAAAPPTAIRESILAKARAAAKPASEAGFRKGASSWLQPAVAFWSWLARPPVAAGFASVMAATIVGLMWWDRPMDEGMPHAPPPAAAPSIQDSTLGRSSPAERPAPGPAAAPAGTTAPSTEPTSGDPPRRDAARDALEKQETSTPPQSPARRAAPTATGVTPPPATRSSADTAGEAQPAAPAATTDAGKAKTDRAPEAFAQERKDAAPSTPAPMQPEAAKPFPLRERNVAEAPAAAPSPPPAATMAKKAEATGALRSSDDRSSQAPGGATANRLAGASPMRPMAGLLAALAADAEAWRRVDSSGIATPVDARWRAWLAAVDAVADRWQRIDRPAARDAGAVAGGPFGVSLERDGRPEASLRVEDGGVLFQPRGEPAWFAPLPPDAVARLRAGRPGPP